MRCRLASQSYPCGNPRSAHAGLWGFPIWPSQELGASLGISRGAPACWMSSGPQLGISDAGVDEICVHDQGRWGAWHEPSRRPSMWRSRLNERIMPGYEWSPGLVVGRSARPEAGTRRKGLDDYHGAAAAGTRRARVWSGLGGRRFVRRRRHPQYVRASARQSLRAEPASRP